MDLAEIVRNQEESLTRAGVSRRRRVRRPRQRRIRPSGPALTDAVRVHRMIRRDILLPIEEDLERILYPALRRLESQYLKTVDRVLDASAGDGMADDLEQILGDLRQRHVDLVDERVQLIASELVGGVNDRNRQRFYASIEKVVGVDLRSIVDEGDLGTVLQLKTQENVGLIKSISADQFEKIERLVYGGVIEGRTDAPSMIKELKELGEITDRRARFIARDQTAKLTAALNQERNEALGIEEYIWRTVEDERVRPDPRVKRKKPAPSNHRIKNGKKFRWDSPPADTGHPGTDFNCRCRAEPVIVL